MAGYPISLQLENKTVLIVGGGKVAARKVPALLAAGAKLTILSPTLHESLQRLAIQHINAPYQLDYLETIKPVLVFAATHNSQLNQEIAEDARTLGAWVNIADSGTDSDFHNMALLEKSPFQIAISSNASSPALLNLLKARISSVLTDGLCRFADCLGELRHEKVLPEQRKRQALYTQLIESEVLSLLESGEIETARSRFLAIVEEAK